jgi:hypothetical protein
MYAPIYLRTENELNKILKRQRKTRQDLGILFVSLWDPHSKTLMKEVKSKLVGDDHYAKPLYIVDSFTMPHAFVIFKTTKLPHLVQFRRGSLLSEDYLTKIYKDLGL